jgi:hypothetical protein
MGDAVARERITGRYRKKKTGKSDKERRIKANDIRTISKLNVPLTYPVGAPSPSRVPNNILFLLACMQGC